MTSEPIQAQLSMSFIGPERHKPILAFVFFLFQELTSRRGIISLLRTLCAMFNMMSLRRFITPLTI